MVPNALAAAAVGLHLGIDAAAIAAGLASFAPVGGRMRHLSLADGVTLIDDTYNANPGSMAAAIESLNELSRPSPSHLVVGDMRELGPRSEALHREMGRKAADTGIGFLYVTGDHAAAVADGASAGGMSRERITTGDKPQLLETLLRQLTAGSWVLVKGSRAMGMEEMVAGITAHCGGAVPTKAGEGR
jgi:UDP-N-acetylmuramyl pentapeptide synthase